MHKTEIIKSLVEKDANPAPLKNNKVNKYCIYKTAVKCSVKNKALKSATQRSS